YEDAVKRLEQMKDWPMSWPVLALAHQRLGKAGEARQWLAEAREAFDNALQDKPADSRLRGPPAALRSGRWDKPQSLLFLREANALIEGPAAEDPWKRLIANRPAFRPSRSSEAELAANLHAIGVLQGELGQDEAEKSLTEALTLREAL